MLRVGIWGVAVLVLAVFAWYIVGIPGESYAGAPAPLSAAERDGEARLRRMVGVLASQERNLKRPESLEAAASFIEATLVSHGYGPLAQRFRVGRTEVRNIEIEIGGGARRDEIVVVGAHYDSEHGSPGANANASGVAALLELARLLHGTKPAKTLRLVWFVNTEAPYFLTEAMGSLQYVRRAAARGERIVAMYALESLGYYSGEPDSQRYPDPFRIFYPSKGNFVAFVGNLGSRTLLHQSIAAFRRVARVPSEAVAAPSFTPDIDGSDHAAFWQLGIPAVMLTDTGPYRYRWYHTEQDTPDRLEYAQFARVVTGLRAMLAEMAGELQQSAK
jgi:Zn-dependent M28 family amino/carboxypeptidase